MGSTMTPDDSTFITQLYEILFLTGNALLSKTVMGKIHYLQKTCKECNGYRYCAELEATDSSKLSHETDSVYICL